MASGKCGENVRWTLDSNGTLTISGTGDMNNWHPRVLTNPPWDIYRESIKKIFIAEGVTSIGSWAFDCENLKSVKIPGSVDTIDDYAFSSCTSLKTVKIPKGVRSIGCDAFGDCTSLTNVIIPGSVFWIKARTFSGCTNLKSVTIPEGVTSIGEKVLDGCKNLKRIYYPEGRGFEKVLGDGNDAKLIPYNPATKAAQINTLPTKKVSKPVVQKTVAEPLRWTFAIKTLTIGGVREIKCYSYADTPWIDSSHKIQKIIFEDGVEEIAANAFIDCERLEQVIIPASVKTIGNCAFTVCYCGERTVNGGRNVIWSLGNGVLMIKKNPAAKSETNFATGFETWQVVEKNIVSVKIERGVVLSKQFFDWMAQRGNNLQVSFV